MNPFSRNYIPQIKLKPTPRETQLHAAGKAQREKIVLADAPNPIHVLSQAKLKAMNLDAKKAAELGSSRRIYCLSSY
jgi:hypothetical protein